MQFLPSAGYFEGKHSIGALFNRACCTVYNVHSTAGSYVYDTGLDGGKVKVEVDRAHPRAACAACCCFEGSDQQTTLRAAVIVEPASKAPSLNSHSIFVPVVEPFPTLIGCSGIFGIFSESMAVISLPPLKGLRGCFHVAGGQ